MANKEATARIRINKLLEAAGWRFFADENKPANIRLETSVTLTASDLNALGDNFEKTGKGFIDFLLLNEKGFPLVVLEAKREDKNPLVGKEQARKYAKSQNCRFVILSNGNLHYFWDLERGNPYLITSFPTPDSVIGYQQVTPDPQRCVEDQLLDKLHALLLELGHGFCFEARQKRILIGESHNFVDLVFYHRILKCHVLVELKVAAFSHENIGHLNTYVSWYRKNDDGRRQPAGRHRQRTVRVEVPAGVAEERGNAALHRGTTGGECTR